MTLFHIIERERAWRIQHKRPEGFPSLARFRPLVAVGAEQPLEEELAIAAYYREPHGSKTDGDIKPYPDVSLLDGNDGLGGIHASV